MRHSLTGLVAALFLSTLAGCAIIPSKLQLVSASAAQTKSTSTATCLLPASHALPVSVDAPALNPQHIAVLNWNVYKGQRRNWAEEFRQLLSNQDLVFLQEALLDDTLEASLRMHQLYWTLNHAFIYGGYATGVLTAARVDPLSSCGLRSTEPLIRTPKTALVQTYRITGQPLPLMVANIHGINFSLDTQVYTEQLQSLHTMLAQHHGPLILAGDFNNWSEARSVVLQNIVASLQLDAILYTNHNATRVFGHAIDHIYYRGLEAISQQTLEVTSSDHNPMQVVFRLKPIHLTWLQP